MYLSRDIIRRFVAAVEWVTPRNIIVLSLGHYRASERANIVIRNELAKLTKTRREPPLKRLPCDGGAVYAYYYSRKKNIGTFKFAHDAKLRDCLAKFLKDRNYEGIDEVSLEPPSDARIGNLFFELDNGHMSPSLLEDKIRRYYSGPGRYRVVFIMASRYLTLEEEQRRLEMIFDIIRRVYPHKPNRILAASYRQFLEDGMFYNFKGDMRRLS